MSRSGFWNWTGGTAFRGKAIIPSWLEQKQAKAAVEQRTEDRRQKAMARELEWIRQSARARQAKSQARISAYETMLKADVAEKEREFELQIPADPGSARWWWTRTTWPRIRRSFALRAPELRLPPGGIVGVVGPNGAGKTTLFRLIVGAEKPDSGVLRVGETVKIAHVDQSARFAAQRLDPLFEAIPAAGRKSSGWAVAR